MSLRGALGGAALVVAFTGLFGTAASLVFGTGVHTTAHAPDTAVRAVVSIHAGPSADLQTAARSNAKNSAPGVRARDLQHQETAHDSPASMPPASAGTNGSFKLPPPGTVSGKHAVARSLEMLATEASNSEGSATLLGGIALAPPSAPIAVQGAISAANMISHTPYLWGGGHGSWYAAGYDCSGAVSFALHGGGLLDLPLTSSQLESYGEPGPGHWITVYANATHAYATIAGLRWDTVGDARGTGPRWHLSGPYPQGFVVRHPIGY